MTFFRMSTSHRHDFQVADGTLKQIITHSWLELNKNSRYENGSGKGVLHASHLISCLYPVGCQRTTCFASSSQTVHIWETTVKHRVLSVKVKRPLIEPKKCNRFLEGATTTTQRKKSIWRADNKEEQLEQVIVSKLFWLLSIFLSDLRSPLWSLSTSECCVGHFMTLANVDFLLLIFKVELTVSCTAGLLILHQYNLKYVFFLKRKGIKI